jgi:hypothetical protein
MTFNSTMPTVDILVNGQKRKVYGKNKDKIYLNDGDNFQLRVFNPLTTRIGMQLKMNSITDTSILVINPGQSVIVDRFIETNKKMKFSTYVVDKNNPLVKNAISENGKLEITFWNEYINFNLNTYAIYSYPNYNNYINGTTLTTSLMESNFCSMAGIPSNNDLHIKGNLRVDGEIINEKLRETGRIEKGEKSNQHFSQTHFQTGTIICNYIFKLLPFSEKKADPPVPINNPYLINTNSYVKSVGRDYCSNTRCNYRIRKNNWTFCPLCGTKLD